jgi:crotonobetainyl-CoA:carnitine CoA-transferase CaiB-like acyl-CoA transferase
MAAVLDGIRVLDLSSSPPGAIASMVLADFGADVIAIERPGGDPLRAFPAAPMWLRGKRSMELDLKTRAGQRRLHELARESDAVIYAGAPGSAERLGADEATLCALNPALVYCSITGFGPRGPLAAYMGYEGVVAAKAGRMMTFAGQVPREGPVFAYVPVGQHVAAQSAVHGILGALLVRERTGEGQRVETSLLQGMMPYDLGGLLVQQMMRRLPAQFPVDPNAQFGRMPTLQYHPVLTKDGQWVQLGNLVEHLFHSFIGVAGLGEIYADERYQGPPNGYAEEAREELRDRILRRMLERTADEWMADFIENGHVAAERFTDTQAALSHPQLLHNGDVIEVETRARGRMKQIGPVAKLLATPAQPAPDAPEPGEHGDALWRLRPERRTPEARGRSPRHPLEGMTVVEFATIIATPYACSILADLGARVIKVEAIEGDQMRGMLQGAGAAKTTAGKESVCLDLKDPRGQAIARQLIERADVLVHNYRPGVPERLGIGYEQVREYRPDIVYVSATGYGSDGPYSHRPNAHPVPGAALGGAFMQAGGPAAMAVSDDVAILRETARQLMRANEVNPDPNTSLVIVSSVLLALWARETQGIGQHVQCNMMLANAYANIDDFVAYEGKAPRPVPDRDLYGLSALYRLYPAADGTWVFLACLTDEEWHGLTDALGLEQLRRDPRFADAESRRAHDAEIAAILCQAFPARHADEWERLLVEAGVGCARADEHGVPQFLDCSEHALENGFVAESDHLRFGPYWRTGSLVNFTRTPARLGGGVLAGQHTRQILRELGYASDEVDAFYAERVVNSELP